MSTKNIQGWMENRLAFKAINAERGIRDVKLNERFIVMDHSTIPTRAVYVHVSRLYWSGSDVCPVQEIKLYIEKELSRHEIDTFVTTEQVMKGKLEQELSKKK